MADIKYIVECDATGALKSIKDLDGAIDKAAGTTAKAGGSSGPFGSLFAQFTAGTLVASALQKGIGALKGAVADAIKGAIEGEQAEANLKAALEITGRVVQGNIQHYLDFAQAQMKATTYTDEQVMASQALLLQLTSLDQQGLDRATKGAMGLATTMGMDLHSATMMVTKAMEGNYTALGRVGIKVGENLTAEQKQATLLDQLEKLYQRSTAETNTFGGALKQLSNNLDEVKEEAGKAVTQNADLRKSIKNLTEAAQELIESGRLATWANGVVVAIVHLAEAARNADTMIRGTFLFRKFESDMADKVHKARIEAVAFQEGLKILKPSMDEIQTAMEKGPSAWKKWSEAIQATDKTLVANKDTIIGWIDQAVKWLGLTDKFGQVFADFGLKTKTQMTAELKKAEEALRILKSSAEATPGSIAKLEDKISKLKDELFGSEKAAKEAADAYKKLGDAAADIVAKYNPLLGAMMKLKAEEDTLTKARKAGAMSADAYDKAMAANAKAMKDVGIEAGKSAKAQGAMVKAAQDIINRYNPMHAAMVKAIDDERKLDAALKAGVITDKAYAKGLESIHKDLDAAADAEKKAKTATSAFAQSAQDLVNKLKVTGPAFKKATDEEKKLMAQLILGLITLKQYKAAIVALNAELADKKGTTTWVENVKSAVAATCAAMNVYYTYVDGKNEQALQKKLAALDTEYEAELKLIEQSMMNEEEKEAAIAALDTKYNALRQAAEIKAAEQRKKTAIAQAIINTAQGVALAWGQGGFLFGAIMAAIVAAAGAVQIALIKSQPIGAAAGAIFKQKALLMSQASGQEYEVAEGGEAEIVSSPRQLREAIMGRGGRGGSAQTIVEHHHHHVYIDGKEMKTFISKTIREGTKSENMLIHPRAIRAY